MEIYTSGKMTSKGQITIPIELRSNFDMNTGDTLQFILTANGEMIVKPCKKKSIFDVTSVLDIKVGNESWDTIKESTAMKVARENIDND